MSSIYQKKITVKDLIKDGTARATTNNFDDTKYTIYGWIDRVRKQSEIIFVELYDGSCAKNLQLIISDNDINKASMLHPAACIMATGKLVKSPAKGQLFELSVLSYDIIGKIDNPQTYLPCGKEITEQSLREHLDLRAKFKSCRAIYRVRSKLLELVHKFFHEMEFHHLDPNVVTTSDCEGAGEVFMVTTLLGNAQDKSIKVDFNQDFFGKPAYLTVSSQLGLEALCSGMRAVYTTNPSFRSEKSKTKRHLASFTHLEWEIAFIDINDLMDFSEEMVMYMFKNILVESKDDLELLNSFRSHGLIKKLESFTKDRFARITYDQAIDLIVKHKQEILKKYSDELSDIPKWGDDLGTCCEKYIADEIYKKPVFVYNYPRDLKSFYMKQNEPHVHKLSDNSEETRYTVQGCDLLIPGCGELIGSSIRETNYKTLVDEMNRRSMDIKPLEWYVNLRKDATFPHGGAGLGFDRLVNICTLMDGNIRDVVPFPVSYKECDF